MKFEVFLVKASQQVGTKMEKMSRQKNYKLKTKLDNATDNILKYKASVN